MSDVTDELFALLTARPTTEHVAAVLVAAGFDRDLGAEGIDAERARQEEEFRARMLERRAGMLAHVTAAFPELVAALDASVAGSLDSAGVASLEKTAAQMDPWEMPWDDWDASWDFEQMDPDQRVEVLAAQLAVWRSDEVEVPAYVLDLPETLGGLADGFEARSEFLTGMEKFASHPGLERPYRSAADALANVGLSVGPADPADAGSLEAFVHRAWLALGVDADRQERVHRSAKRAMTRSRWKTNPKGARGDKRGSVDVRELPSSSMVRAMFPGVSVSAYRRAAGALAHLESRVRVLAQVQATERCVRFGKSRLAGDITREDMAADLPTAAFVAYYTARLSGRTLFTVGSQARPMDAIAEALLAGARESAGFRADVVARVYTAPSVLAELDDAELGRLLGRYYQVMGDAAGQLEGMWDAGRDRSSMVVRRGEDSSGWNMASRAFNQARTGWLSLMAAAGLAEVAAARLPGKVPALVAGDVAYWHESEGGSQHADIALWAGLPLPWEVLDGRAECTAAVIEAAASAAGLDAAATGWTAPYRQEGAEVSRSTPALVHGVAVFSDELAGHLRASGVFGGYAVKVRGPQRASGALAPEV